MIFFQVKLLCGFLFLFLWAANAFSGSLDIDVIKIPAGNFFQGSDRKEREYAYVLDEKAYGHSVTRKQKWYENEFDRKSVFVDEFHIMKNLVTNEDYAKFIKDTGHLAPYVEQKIWDGYGLIHPYSRAKPFFWNNSLPPKDKITHPVVAVSYFDVTAYAKWLSKKTGHQWRLPSEIEWEKASRGVKGRYFPWGNEFFADKLNSHDRGPFRTVPIGSFPDGASPFGLLDGAGQVFEWVSAPKDAKRAFVKGGSWDDKGCGTCRPAARHTRPKTIKHILVGFRLVR